MNYPHASPDTHKEAVYDPWIPQPGLEVAPQPTRPLYGAPVPYTPSERLICGIRRPTFFLSVALIIVIIAAAVGGGVGGSLAVTNAKSACASNSTNETTIVTTTITQPAATGTPTATTTSSGPLVVPTGVLALDCPGLGDDMAISLGSASWVFTPTCNVDYAGDDFGAVIVYSFHDCLQACAAHNHFSGDGGSSCVAVTFRANQTKAVPKDFGNCWLKSGEPAAHQITGADLNLVAGATLKGSTG